MTEPIRVLMISGEYPPMEGGVADFTAIVSEKLHARGAQVHVLTSHAAQDAREAESAQVHAVMDDWGFGPLVRKMRELIADVRPDVVNIQYQTAAYGMHPAINLLPRFFPQIPVVVTFTICGCRTSFPKPAPFVAGSTWILPAPLMPSSSPTLRTVPSSRKLQAYVGWRRSRSAATSATTCPKAMIGRYGGGNGA